MNLRRIVIGSPLPRTRIVHERLGKTQALVVLSSDTLSSVAYATAEILLVLLLAGSGVLGLSWPIALAIQCRDPRPDPALRRWRIYVVYFVPMWHHLLPNETPLALKITLLFSRQDWKGQFHIITAVPFYLSHQRKKSDVKSNSIMGWI